MTYGRYTEHGSASWFHIIHQSLLHPEHFLRLSWWKQGVWLLNSKETDSAVRLVFMWVDNTAACHLKSRTTWMRGSSTVHAEERHSDLYLTGGFGCHTQEICVNQVKSNSTQVHAQCWHGRVISDMALNILNMYHVPWWGKGTGYCCRKYTFLWVEICGNQTQYTSLQKKRGSSKNSHQWGTQ